MPEPITSTGTIIGAFVSLFGAVFGRARLEGKPSYRVVDRTFEPELPVFVSEQVDVPASLPVKAAEPEPIQRMEPPERPLKKVKLAPEKAVHVFIKYMQAAKTTGVFAYEEIDEFWGMACDQLHLVELTGEIIREQLESLGYFIGRRQLTRDFPEVKIRTGRGRATLYEIPSKARSAARPPSHGLDDPDDNHPLPGTPTGHCPVSDENPNEIRRAA